MVQSFLEKDVKNGDVWAQNSRDSDLMNLETCPGVCIFQGHQGILMKITLPFGNIHLKILSTFIHYIFQCKPEGWLLFKISSKKNLERSIHGDQDAFKKGDVHLKACFGIAEGQSGWEFTWGINSWEPFPRWPRSLKVDVNIETSASFYSGEFGRWEERNGDGECCSNAHLPMKLSKECFHNFWDWCKEGQTSIKDMGVVGLPRELWVGENYRARALLGALSD